MSFADYKLAGLSATCFSNTQFRYNVQFQKIIIHTPPTERIGISWGVGGSQTPKHLKKFIKLYWNFQRDRGSWKIPSVGEVWIFSGTTSISWDTPRSSQDVCCFSQNTSCFFWESSDDLKVFSWESTSGITLPLKRTCILYTVSAISSKTSFSLSQLTSYSGTPL